MKRDQRVAVNDQIQIFNMLAVSSRLLAVSTVYDKNEGK